MGKNRENFIISNVVRELASIREKNKISKNSLSEKTGLNRRTIQFIEEEKRSPTLYSLLKLAKGLQVSLGDIITTYEARE